MYVPLVGLVLLLQDVSNDGSEVEEHHFDLLNDGQLSKVLITLQLFLLLLLLLQAPFQVVLLLTYPFDAALKVILISILRICCSV